VNQCYGNPVPIRYIHIHIPVPVFASSLRLSFDTFSGNFISFFPHINQCKMFLNAYRTYSPQWAQFPPLGPLLLSSLLRQHFLAVTTKYPTHYPSMTALHLGFDGGRIFWLSPTRTPFKPANTCAMPLPSLTGTWALPSSNWTSETQAMLLDVDDPRKSSYKPIAGAIPNNKAAEGDEDTTLITQTK